MGDRQAGAGGSQVQLCHCNASGSLFSPAFITYITAVSHQSVTVLPQSAGDGILRAVSLLVLLLLA